ncbi:MAG: hypothetical protein JEY96_18335 [Bacteroidales bacterium]|nr:hypothetical protein [Bacteroidales bacterium]
MDYIIEKTLCDLNIKNKETQILQIGPADYSFHYYPKINALSTPECCNHGDDINTCMDCPVRYQCLKGKNIVNGQFEYKHQSFDQIVITSGTSLSEDKIFQNVNNLLKYNGEILFFINNQKNKTKHNKKSIFFNSGEFLKLVNKHQLTIESVKNIRDQKNKEIYCIICKN